ncbi:hypothetical protein GCM10022243_20420 [Saccharothrix violaceirubra]|uniref:GNAT superfamily N-acetyltransferase n=1 Tax=Saccharothrix violaceirubra TaxID=413306 RepID=A0A7W7T4B7_9PSEU|nr:GNAT family N-acetyltransferase [Saccharothrix violaceirubra]MBB4965055.1 GNAT superfamily N-acetyltransferase [Saccharothrix violaceirubra]
MTTATLDVSARNTASFWEALAWARGGEVVRRPGFAATSWSGLSRIVVLRPELSPDDRAELERLLAAAEGAVRVQDVYRTLDLSDLGYESRSLPLMVRDPAPLPTPSVEITRVATAADLAVAERVIIEGFPVPERPGLLLPGPLLERPDVDVLIAWRDGEAAGACFVVDDGVAGLYWMTTSPAHRSRGVGRALMYAVLDRPAPVVLTASKAGRPLYESLGFRTVGDAAWWGDEPVA